MLNGRRRLRAVTIAGHRGFTVTEGNHMGSSVAELLRAWREAERRWELPGSPEQVRAAALEVVTAWANYQNASLADDTDEFLFVADEAGAYVAATNGVRRVLGYEPNSLIGRRIADITAPAIFDQTPAHWERFLAEGRMEGTYLLRHALGTVVEVNYQARAHHPVPGFHVSRLWPRDPGKPS
jgi:PAS domain S-box-containing protein